MTILNLKEYERLRAENAKLLADLQVATRANNAAFEREFRLRAKLVPQAPRAMAIKELQEEKAKLRAAFLLYIAGESECSAFRHNQPLPCHAETWQCRCLCELETALEAKQ